MTFPFNPLRFLGNPHVQTIVGNLWKGAPVFLPARVHVVPLADGDALAVHDTVPPSWHPEAPLLVLVHGLGGSHQSPYLQRLTNTFNAHGWRVVRVDLRGAGAGVHLARRIYNAASADDLRAVAEHFHREAPAAPLYLAGFSLGGTIVLALAGDAARRPLPGLRAVAAVSPPVDLVLCSAMLARQPFYDRFYARNLRLQVQHHQRRQPHLPRVRFPNPLSVRLFDELYTAPRGGFADAMDYYRRASSLPVIPDIQVPAFVLSSVDDPFIAAEPLRQLQGLPNLETQLVSHGGHLGFLGRDGAGGFRWGEQRLAQWLISH